MILVTGRPGVGKTTVIERICEHYRRRGLKVAGMTTQEVRMGNERIGFKLKDLASDLEGWLAKKEAGTGPRIGRYSVVSEDLERIGVKALEDSFQQDADLILVDEVGPMEMTSPRFRRALSHLLNGDKILVATVKYNSHYPEIENSLRDPTVKILELTRENRDKTAEQLIAQLDRWIENPNS